MKRHFNIYTKVREGILKILQDAPCFYYDKLITSKKELKMIISKFSIIERKNQQQ